MNTEWFRQLLAAKKLSQRKLAKLMDLDIALENGEHVVLFLQRGYRSGTFNLINGADGAALRTDASVVWASRVLWIKPT